MGSQICVWLLDKSSKSAFSWRHIWSKLLPACILPRGIALLGHYIANYLDTFVPAQSHEHKWKPQDIGFSHYRYFSKEEWKTPGKEYDPWWEDQYYSWYVLSVILSEDHFSCQIKCASCLSKASGLPNALWGNIHFYTALRFSW